MKRVVAGIDIGGTKIAVAIADDDGRVLSMTRFPTRTERDPFDIIDEAVEKIQAMVREAEAALIGVGVGCGGPLSRERGVTVNPPHLPGWEEFPIVEHLEKRFGVPVNFDNDANAAALGEHEYGAGRGLRNLIYITISTGIGGGIIVGGEIVHGIGDGAGEIGHSCVQPDGVQCLCGARGCMEMLCSGTNIARRAKERLAQGAGSSMQRFADEAGNITTEMVVDAARGGDPLANEIWDETIRFLAIGINNIIVTLAPQAVILGGGVSTVGEMLLVPLRRELAARVKILPVEQVQILQAALGGDSGIYGALMLGRQVARGA